MAKVVHMSPHLTSRGGKNQQIQKEIKVPTPSLHRGLAHPSSIPMKHGYSKNGAVPIPDTFWVLVLLGYFCMRTPGVPKFFNKKKKSFYFIFSFGYFIKKDKSSENGGYMNFRSNYMDVHFFYLLFWILIYNLKTI